MKNKFVVPFMLVFFASSTLFAADGKISKETRQKMAEAHSKMADCLKSDKTMKECRGEMMKSCKEHMGESGCGMMGKGMRGKKMKGHNHDMDHMMDHSE